MKIKKRQWLSYLTLREVIILNHCLMKPIVSEMARYVKKNFLLNDAYSVATLTQVDKQLFDTGLKYHEITHESVIFVGSSKTESTSGSRTSRTRWKDSLCSTS